ncbi:MULTISPECIES: Gfo/Idh/MocA family protein [Paraliobacillus]|uniref:Gfo/Idh/MocA family protein n=1 Tax=Paraliobacillus TaxID=200903 RepID=UPI000DD37E07|nr:MULTISPECIES: Gfo/Idh/MocA family oxidoreductase [Paraliobacillus]
MTLLNAGLIGCGFISEKHVQILSQLKDKFHLIAVADSDLGRADKIKALLPTNKEEKTVALFTDYQALLELGEIDVVIITTPSGLHSTMIKQALSKGKHVIVEKPFVLSLKDANEIIALSEACNRQVLVCHQLRYRPIFQKTKALIEQNQFGKLYTASASVQINRPKEYYQQASWRGTWEDDGGMLLNQGLHVADLLLWFMGDIQSIYGKTKNFASWKETEDVAVGTIQFKNDVPGTISANALTQPKNIGYALHVVSENGTVAFSGPALNQVERFYLENESISEKEVREIAMDHEDRLYMYKDFYQALTNPEHTATIDVYEAKKVLEFIFGLYYSDKLNKEVRFPITDFSTIQMQQNSDKEGK